MSNAVKDFILMTKPRVWIFLLITGLAGEIFSLCILKKLDYSGFIFVAIYIAFGLMGSESISNYIDIDIDRKMNRTKNRQLPSGKMSPKEALYGGLILVALSLLMAYIYSPLSFLFMLTGIIDYDIVYAKLTKRKTTLNIILGAYSGGAPLLAGFYAFTDKFNIVIILWFFIIFLWTPLHIWSLSIRYRDDYSNASVPMLPVVLTPKKTMMVLFPVAILTSFTTILSGYFFMKYFNEMLSFTIFSVYIMMSVYLFLEYLLAFIKIDERIMKLFVSTNIFVGIFFLSVAIFSFLIPL
ncbi:MAG: protoheme IX farnesyltransferase [Thermoplasmata archaeon]